jgi:hypothetical protein
MRERRLWVALGAALLMVLGLTATPASGRAEPASGAAGPVGQEV